MLLKRSSAFSESSTRNTTRDKPATRDPDPPRVIKVAITAA
jgi:hypothetical protein